MNLKNRKNTRQSREEMLMIEKDLRIICLQHRADLVVIVLAWHEEEKTLGSTISLVNLGGKNTTIDAQLQMKSWMES
jgi:hypothetical protein